MNDKRPSIERRHAMDLRDAIDRFIWNGFEVTGRNPVTLRRGRAGYQLQNGCLVVADEQK